MPKFNCQVKLHVHSILVNYMCIQFWFQCSSHSLVSNSFSFNFFLPSHTLIKKLKKKIFLLYHLFIIRKKNIEIVLLIHDIDILHDTHIPKTHTRVCIVQDP